MAKREIVRVLKDNHTSDAGQRMDEEMILAGIKLPHMTFTAIGVCVGEIPRLGFPSIRL